MILKDLNELAIIAKEKSRKYDEQEFIFSETFKTKYKEISYDEIDFYKYTSVVRTKGNLKIIIPNQWFVIASFFCDFITALVQYKKIAEELKILQKATIYRDSKNIDSETETNIDSYFSDSEDSIKFKKFMTDYTWWFGSKTIDRADYYVSPVLNLAGVVNVTQTYIADLANTLSKFPDLNLIIENDLKNLILTEEKNKKESIILSSKNLNDFAFKTFKLLIDKYGFEQITKDKVFKDSKINNVDYEGLKLKNAFGSNNLIGIFEQEQTKESLKSSNIPRYFDKNLNLDEYPYTYFTTQWADTSEDGLTFSSLEKFISDITQEKFKIKKNGDNYSLIECYKQNASIVQKIYYGAPGTGKSHKIETILKDIPENQKERVTFHPEYDYSSFVGGYRPSSEMNDDGTTGDVKYKFVPQIFTKIYVEAWKNPYKDYYLAIEEINRGNCAEIFGDLFQLLDRNSNYSISPSNELREYLEKVLNNEEWRKGIADGKMKLPSNLHILASMNTSDQSLFPMDSAFKRRWSWEYVPIWYEEFNDDRTESNEPTRNLSFDYKVKIDEQLSFKWIEFIESVNKLIKGNRNLGSDKCIGNYFIKPRDGKEIKLEEFINKAVFYLWVDVFKDEEESIFSSIEDGTSYEDFFPVSTNGKEKLIKLLSENILDVKIIKPEIPPVE